MPKQKVPETVTEFNRVVEKTQNEMLLLNIVRASKRRPMYFTGFNQLRGALSYNVQSGNLTLPFGKVNGGDGVNYSIAPSVGFTNSPSFDVITLDNKDFTRGLMTPISLETLNGFLEQGWPGEMVGLVAIERIEEEGPQGSMRIFENKPFDKKHPGGFLQFQKKVHELLGCGLQVTKKPSPIGPALSEEQAANLEQLLKVHQAGLQVEQEPAQGPCSPTYRLTSRRAVYSPARCGSDGKTRAGDQVMERPEAVSIVSGREGAPPSDISKSAGERDTLILRSPEGMLYYLGEILRNCGGPGLEPLKVGTGVDDAGRPTEAPLFSARIERAADDSPLVSVDYDGDRYVIPREAPVSVGDSKRADRSMHVLMFISLVLAMQRTGEAPPPTGAVNVVGR